MKDRDVDLYIVTTHCMQMMIGLKLYRTVGMSVLFFGVNDESDANGIKKVSSFYWLLGFTKKQEQILTTEKKTDQEIRTVGLGVLLLRYCLQAV